MTEPKDVIGLGERLDNLDKWAKRVRALWIIAVFLIGGIFAAGGYAAYLKSELTTKLNEFEKAKSDIENLKKANPVTWEVFFSESIVNGESETLLIPNAKYCSFSRADTIPQNQACGCTLKRGSTDWTLAIVADSSLPNSKCRCEAVCIR